MSDLQKRLFLERKNGNLLDAAHQAASRYLRNIEFHPVYPSTQQLKALDNMADTLPESPVDGIEIIEQLAHLGEHTTVKQISGRYFGFVNGNALPVGQAARWLADIWDQNAALHVMSPISAKLEDICQMWLIDLLKLPRSTVAGLVGGTSVATLCALAAARQRQLQKLNWDIAQKGLFAAPQLRIILGRQTHGTVVKMLNILGFGQQHIEWVDCDPQGRMIPEQIPTLGPECILVLQAGNVCSGAFDDFDSIIPKANAADCWVHIDGAFGLWAAACKPLAYLTKSVQLADSWSVDGHKTLNTPYDCGIVLCKHQSSLVEALHQQGSYIQSSEQRDNMQYTPDMSRRARGIDLWACLASLGRSGISDLVLLLHEQAVALADKLARHHFEICNDVVFNQVMVACEDPQHTIDMLEIIQRSGVCWCGGATWFGRPIIRISLCSWATTEQDLVKTTDTFVAARQLIQRDEP